MRRPFGGGGAAVGQRRGGKSDGGVFSGSSEMMGFQFR